MKNLNQRTDLIELHGLEFITNQQGSMFVHNCSIYKTKYENIFITDYDLMSNEPLLKKDLFCIFFKNGLQFRYFLISNLMIGDVDYVNKMIEEELINQ